MAGRGAGREAGSRATALRAAAYGFIEDHLADPGLGAARIAAAIGVSERHLSRVLAAGGMTVPRLVRSRRLEVAYAMLAGPADLRLAPSVAEVAARCGFTSAAYFSHAFRARFGLRAGEVRRAGALRSFAFPPCSGA
jgi:AraC-like DNA-binding protein